MKKTLLFSTIVLALVACNNSKTSSESKDKAKTDEETTTIENNNSIVPERIYATNTATPIRENHVVNVIDSDNSTIWKTPLGAGTDEGIMFYFDKSIRIESIEITQAEGNEFARVSNFIIYGDGNILENQDETNRTIIIDTDVTSLFIRIGERDDKQNKTKELYPSDPDLDYTDEINQEFYPTDKCVGISEIRFIDSDGNKIDIVAPKIIDCNITASSTLKPKQAYSPNNLTDNKKEFAWAEGSESGGENEWVNFSFSESVSISAIKIWNGYQRSESHFTNNTRAKDITISDLNNIEHNISLNDSQDPQLIDLGEALTRNDIKLNINTIYPGKKYKDMVISEIVFYENGKPILPYNSFEEEKITNTNNIVNKQLKSIINRLVKTKKVYESYVNETGVDNKSHSLIIRANNSFVYYGESYTNDADVDENTVTTIAEGNWELIEEKSKSARIKIFGKMYESSTSSNMYTGKSENTSTNIFQDYLTITDSTITGESFIEEINLLW